MLPAGRAGGTPARVSLEQHVEEGSVHASSTTDGSGRLAAELAIFFGEEDRYGRLISFHRRE